MHDFFRPWRDNAAMPRDILERHDALDATIMTVDGARTRDEVAAGVARLIEEFKDKPTRNVIVDIREAVYDQPVEDILRDWSLVAALLPRANVAIVHSPRTVTPALATVGALEASHHVADAFETLDEAYGWIGERQSAA